MLTSALYWLSAGLMIPVIVLLLLAVGWSLLLLGDVYGDFSSRLRHRASLEALAESAERGELDSLPIEAVTRGESSFARHLQRLVDHDWQPTRCEKVLADHALATRRDLDTSLTLMRVGPMLGLMGTLIPMGPALAGLASGDIASMATNMQVAFSTTVVGIFVGAVGFMVQTAKKRWHQADHDLLAYVVDLIQEARQ
ncbi:MAG: MotA/TolQ/ExbB proton channel family protein [Acidobacteriota bacterium]